MTRNGRTSVVRILLASLMCTAGLAYAGGIPDCGKVPSHAELKKALAAARAANNGGFNLDKISPISAALPPVPAKVSPAQK